MVKHNNIIPNQHFRKDWQRHVKTWFNQPARKESRRAHRLQKAKTVAPRPLNLLRPIVRGQTNKYNGKIRAGRGFTLEELRAAKINPKEARGIGLSVDHRRKNRNEEAFRLNVDRIKLYKSKLIVFPRKPTSKRAKKGDSTKEDRAAAKQVLSRDVLPIAVPAQKQKARKITSSERSTSAYSVARKARTDALLWGVREKRAKDKADAALGKKPKDTADAGADE